MNEDREPYYVYLRAATKPGTPYVNPRRISATTPEAAAKATLELEDRPALYEGIAVINELGAPRVWLFGVHVAYRVEAKPR